MRALTMDVPTANTEDHALIDSDLTKMMKEAEGIQKEAAEISADLFSGRAPGVQLQLRSSASTGGRARLTRLHQDALLESAPVL